LERDVPMSGSKGKPRGKLAAAARNRSKGGETDEWLTVDEVCRIIKIGRRTFERYLSCGTGPRIKRLGGNGSIRIRRDWLDEWMDDAV
jgi:excisionase family DNA binding protein